MTVGSAPEPRSERLGITISLVLLGLLLSTLAPLPARRLSLDVLGSDLTLDLTGSVQLLVIMAALVCAGVDGYIRTHPQLPSRSLWYTATFWFLPMVVTISGLVLLTRVTWWGYQLGLIALVGGALTLIVVAQYHSIVGIAPGDRLAHAFLPVATYLVALLLYIGLYGARLRSVLSATGILFLSAGLALELYRHTGASTLRVWLYGVLTGGLMSEMTWGLNYTRANARVGGAFLLVAFYVLTGLAQQSLWRRLTRRVVLEYAAVALVGLVALALLA